MFDILACAPFVVIMYVGTNSLIAVNLLIIIGTIPKDPPVVLDAERSLEDPFNFKEWLDKHRDDIHSVGKREIFDGSKYQMQAKITNCHINISILTYFDIKLDDPVQSLNRSYSVNKTLPSHIILGNVVLQAYMYGKGENNVGVDFAETWIWQWVR